MDQIYFTLKCNAFAGVRSKMSKFKHVREGRVMALFGSGRAGALFGVPPHYGHTDMTESFTFLQL